MSDAPTPDQTGGPDGERTQGLDPHLADLAEEALSDFRAWIREHLTGDPGDETPPPDPASFDVESILRLFVALDQDIKTQTRAVREALGKAAPTPNDDPDTPKYLKPLLEVRDALALSVGRAERLKADVLPRLASIGKPRRRGFWARSSGLSESETADLEFVGQSIEGFLTGYEMSLSRLDGFLASQGLEPIPAVGLPFDPEKMEIVELVAGADFAPNQVVEEVRRGYLYRGRIFRFALVKAAKSAAL